MRPIWGNPRKLKTTFTIITVLVSTGGIHVAVRAQASRDPFPSGQRANETPVSRILQAMSLSGGVLTKVTVPVVPGHPMQTTVEIDRQPYTLDLAPHSVRSKAFEVKAQLADGSYVSVDPGPSRTYRGRVSQIDGSVVAASLLDDGLHARIILPGGDNLWIEPVASYLADPARDEHIVYHSRDVPPNGGTCMALRVPGTAAVEATATSTSTGGSSFTAELAVDADVEYFQSFGSVPNTTAQIEMVINLMNIQYIRDASIEHTLTTIIVRTAEPDPYSTTDPGDLLVQFRNHWLNQQSGVQRDIAELFTGKNIDGSVIGIAWLSSVCSTGFGYSVVQSTFSSSLACRTDLSAHELGHNWGADHCGCPGWTMNPSIQCANRFHPTFTIPDILFHRNTRTCLDVGPGFVCPTSNAPQSEIVTVPKNRYLTFVGANPSELTAVQLTIVDLPPPHDVLNGTVLWLGETRQISENPAKVDPADAPGFGSFTAATFQCDPFFADWGALGTVHAYGPVIVPGGTYELRQINALCPVSDTAALSAPLVLQTSAWGDIVENCQRTPCGPPDGTIDVPTDIVSILDKFTARPGAPIKSRVDLEPSLPDAVINITDVTVALEAFRGAPFPFLPPPSPCP